MNNSMLLFLIQWVLITNFKSRNDEIIKKYQFLLEVNTVCYLLQFSCHGITRPDDVTESHTYVSVLL